MVFFYIQSLCREENSLAMLFDSFVSTALQAIAVYKIDVSGFVVFKRHLFITWSRYLSFQTNFFFSLFHLHFNGCSAFVFHFPPFHIKLNRIGFIGNLHLVFTCTWFQRTRKYIYEASVCISRLKSYFLIGSVSTKLFNGNDNFFTLWYLESLFGKLCENPYIVCVKWLLHVNFVCLDREIAVIIIITLHAFSECIPISENR